MRHQNRARAALVSGRLVGAEPHWAMIPRSKG